VPSEAVGSVIGRRGHNIKDLTDSFSVKISVGKWYEKGRGPDEEYSERFEGVIISGRDTDVRQAACKVQDITKEALSFEPAKKRQKPF
jgi:predicted PilT family ATPase